MPSYRSSFSQPSPPGYFFFFKQKTAYEIGLGIPAEPLFRSPVLQTPKYNVDDVALGVCKTGAEEAGVTEVRTSLSEKKFELWRSEERRVGKECRSRGGADY